MKSRIATRKIWLTCGVISTVFLGIFIIFPIPINRHVYDDYLVNISSDDEVTFSFSYPPFTKDQKMNLSFITEKGNYTVLLISDKEYFSNYQNNLTYEYIWMQTSAENLNLFTGFNQTLENYETIYIIIIPMKDIQNQIQEIQFRMTLLLNFKGRNFGYITVFSIISIFCFLIYINKLQKIRRFQRNR